MVEKLKKIKTKQIVMFSVLAFMLVLVVGTTYAYFTAKVIGNDEAKNTQVYAGIMSLKLDGTQELNASNMLPGATKEVEFSVENTGTLTTTYELDMKEVYNNFVYIEELEYTLEQDGTVILNEAIAPSTDEVILPAVVINPKEKQTYKLKLTFKETGDDQNANQNKTFSGKVQISGIDSSNYLQAKVLARSINTNEPDFTNGDPLYLTSKYINKNNERSINSKISGNRAIGDGYTFNEKTGLYTLTNVKTDQTFNKSTIGKYACPNNTGICEIMYKIKEVQESSEPDNYTINIATNKNISYISNNNKIVSDNYHIDQETGYYFLDNPSEVKSYNQSDIGKYTCNNTTSKCSTMYKINSVTDTTVNNVDTYTRTTNYNKIIKSDEYSINYNAIYSKSGLYKTNDDDKDSYYFRGKIDNNYVSFANNLWKIVRINNDGSIRIIRTTSIITDVFNKQITPVENRVGYTYNNESNCTKENPCISDYNNETSTFINNKTVTDSTIKTNLETWYINNLANYNDKIVLSDYCNDTSIAENDESGYTYYGVYERIVNKHQPTLQCPDTSVNYGGNYKLKIGLLSADEMNYAGYLYSSQSNIATGYNFLDNSNYWASMSPYRTHDNSAEIFYGTSKLTNNFTNSQRGTYPVINLKSDIKITDGDGSKSNPYVVE